MRMGPRQTNRPADDKLLPAIPLPFDEVMSDVLKMKPPEKVPSKPKRGSRKTGIRKKRKMA
jgi:hypothetical protein